MLDVFNETHDDVIQALSQHGGRKASLSALSLQDISAHSGH